MLWIEAEADRLDAALADAELSYEDGAFEDDTDAILVMLEADELPRGED